MYKVAVLGERDSVYGFAAVGMEVFPVADPSRAGRLIKTLREEEYAILFVTESVYARLDRETTEGCMALPAIVPIPGASGNTGLGVQRVKDFVRRAVGSDILFGNQ